MMSMRHRKVDINSSQKNKQIYKKQLKEKDAYLMTLKWKDDHIHLLHE